MSRDIKYIGMDIHKEAIVIAVLNGSGKLVMETVVRCSEEAFRRLERLLVANARREGRLPQDQLLLGRQRYPVRGGRRGVRR